MGAVADQLAALDEPARSVVGTLLDRARALVPEVEEGRSYGMPAYLYRGRPLVAVAVTRRGYSVYPFSGRVTAVVAGTLDGADATKGALRFTGDRPLPDAAVDALVRERRAEIDAALDAPGGR